MSAVGPTTAAPAAKEWAAIVRALLSGEQILDVRKGGIREAGRHFDVPATRFWLYPTVEHQRPELLKPAYSRWVEEAVAAAPPDRAIRVEGFCDLVAHAKITNPAALHALDGNLIWTTEYAERRLQWKSKDPLWILVLRTYRLATPIEVPWQEAYGGCTTWVTLDGLPPDPAELDHEPALSDVAFEARYNGVRNTLEGVGVTLEVSATA